MTVRPAGSPASLEAGDDRHPGREAAERIAQGARVVPAAIFAGRRLVGHGRPIAVITHCEADRDAFAQRIGDRAALISALNERPRDRRLLTIRSDTATSTDLARIGPLAKSIRTSMSKFKHRNAHFLGSKLKVVGKAAADRECVELAAVKAEALASRHDLGLGQQSRRASRSGPRRRESPATAGSRMMVGSDMALA